MNSVLWNCNQDSKMIFLENSCQHVSGNILVIFFSANYTSDTMSNLGDAVKSD